jgi:hypothetical protein
MATTNASFSPSAINPQAYAQTQALQQQPGLANGTPAFLQQNEANPSGAEGLFGLPASPEAKPVQGQDQNQPPIGLPQQLSNDSFQSKKDTTSPTTPQAPIPAFGKSKAHFGEDPEKEKKAEFAGKTHFGEEEGKKEEKKAEFASSPANPFSKVSFGEDPEKEKKAE